MLAMLAIGSFSFVPSLANADTEIQRIWVQMRGGITDWGGTPVFGWIGAQARMANVNGTYREWAGVHATWSYERRRINCSEPPTENFTFSFYTAKLIDATAVRLNYSSYNFVVTGYWNVFNITTAINVDENGELISFTRNVVPLVTNATGELRVFSNWHQFELGIAGIDQLSGLVFGHRIAYVEIKMCDTNNDGKVDLKDLVRVAKRYHTMPGLLNYDHDLDFNYDDEINIGDLTTLAANIEG
jgi:hypothetical protein